MDYFFKVNGLIILLYLFYYLMLRNETFFKSIRFYFIAGLVIMIIFPLIEIPVYVEKAVSHITYSITDGATKNMFPVKKEFDWSQLLVLIYIGGVLFFATKFIMQLLSLINLLTKHEVIRQDKYKLVETEGNISPFSFFNYIIYNKGQFKTEELKQIIKHEKTHVNQWHTIDTLLTYILQIIFWFNPFAWLYKKATQQNLEFLADASANDNTDNKKQYQFTLLKACNNNYSQEMTNNFYNSLIKKRILMLNKSKSKSVNYLKYTLILPLLVVFLFTLNTKTIAQKESSEKMPKELSTNKNQTDPIYILNGKEISKEMSEIIDPDKIDSVNVLKNNSATEKYGDKGKNGVVEINTKSKKNSSVAFQDKDPLIILDGKEISKKEMDNVSPDDIESINIVKNKSAKTKYGKKGEDGVIEITSKSYQNATENNRKTVIKESKDKQHYDITFDSGNGKSESFIDSNGENIEIKGSGTLVIKKENLPLIYVGKKEITKSELEKITPNNIKGMNVLKGKKATEKYGKKAKNGVIEITLKKE